MEGLELGGIVALGFGLIKTIEKAFDHLMARRNGNGNGRNGHCGFDAATRAILTRTDDVGSPLVYGARMLDQQREMASTLRKVEDNTRRMADFLEREA